MKKMAALISGLVLTGLAMAESTPKKEVKHIVPLIGLSQGEGRYIRTDIIENGQYKLGYYFCATNHTMIYGDTIYADEVGEYYRMERSIKFSICQDETLTQCQEFASDQFTLFKNSEGYLETDSRPIMPVSIASIKDNFKTCEPNPDMPAVRPYFSFPIHSGERTTDYLLRN